ncbi:3D domain-containing protein [Pseudolactococcus reticulitermitis]
MRKRLLGLTLCLILLTPSIGRVFANDKTSTYDAEIKAAQSKASGIQADLEASLTAVNLVYQKAYASKQAVADGESKIADLTSQIAKTDDEIKAREAVMASQMRQAQTENVSSSFIETIMASGNFSDMITRVVSLTTYRKMQNEKVEKLNDLKTASTKLKSDLESQQTQLKENAKAYETEYDQLETKLDTLRTQMADNQAQMADLSSSKAAEEKRQADETAREKAKEIAEPKPSQSAGAGQPNAPADTGNTGDNSPAPIAPNTPSGKSMTVSTTGYSSDGADGMTPGHITATGIDLWVNPMCVAVDPSVIPLGSMVEVPGYGIAIAGDTGGAIKGYKVDLHFKTTKAAINWGRRTVTIKVLG